jgi:PncC family amidohydrolase
MTFAEEIVAVLTKVHKTVAIAESCTGGMVASSLVEAPGTSACFKEGYITYCDEAKEKLLGVSHETIATYSAVSAQAAEEMAQGVRQKAGADYGLAVTGIAGPGSLSEDLPAGLVFIACADGNETVVRRFELPGDREGVREQATGMALDLLCSVIAKNEGALCES